MIDESLLKSNFLGRDGFRWWIGQIPAASAQGGQINGAGWGNRFKVRIMGYHPYNTVDLADEDLPWAQALIPTTSGSGAANVATDVKLQPGDVVFGFFLDGDNAQIPVIMGCFGRTSQVADSEASGPFQPFTGYTDKIKKPNGTLKPDQSNEANAASQKSPRHVAPKQATSIGTDEVSYFSGIGDTVQLASGSGASTINKISTEVDNLINKVQNLTSNISASLDYVNKVIDREINRITTKIQSVISGLIGGMVNDLFKKISPLLNKGLKFLYKQIYSLVLSATSNPGIAHLAGVAAQTAMVPAVKFLQEQIPCITNSIAGGIASTVKTILKSLVDNVKNFVSCAGNQFCGAIINDIIGKISGGLQSAIGGVSKLLKFFGGFSVSNTLREGTSGISGIVGALNCGQSAAKDSGVSQWVIGSGPKNVPAIPFDKILKTANEANTLAQSATNGLEGVQSILSSFDIFNSSTLNPKTNSPTGGCYTGPPTSCNSPTVNIFGGGGSGSTAIPLFGSIVGEGSTKTGSIIGVKITNPGSGYDFPPFIEIVDNCKQGYGCIARSVLNDAGQVESIYVVSEGENYPINEIEPYVVSDVSILDPGYNYTKGDYGFDNFGNQYELEIINGSINKVKPLNNNEISDLPLITIRGTGTGALLKPNLDTLKFQGKVEQVIDCITK
jgi:hypothetical protein